MNNIDKIDLSHLDGSIFGKPDNQTTASRLLEYYNSKNKTVNPEELGTYFEGDILIPESRGQNKKIKQSYRWANATIPYKIDGKFTRYELSILNQGFDDYHKNTCIKFIPRTTENDYISIVNGNSGCWSSVGKIGGRQVINIQTPGCLFPDSGTFIHELMHVVGFQHEHNRYERDDFITINYDNIDKKHLKNFVKAKSKTISDFRIPYDYYSIVHYSPRAFSKNGKPTITRKYKVSSNSNNWLGQRKGLSIGDIAKINLMYQCDDDLNFLKSRFGNNNTPSETNSVLQLLQGLGDLLMR